MTANLTADQLEADVTFLADRMAKQEQLVTPEGKHRETGRSSNAIVTAVYGTGEQKDMPYDRGDYTACVITVRKMPWHRRQQAIPLLWRARHAWSKRATRV